MALKTQKAKDSGVSFNFETEIFSMFQFETPERSYCQPLFGFDQIGFTASLNRAVNVPTLCADSQAMKCGGDTMKTLLDESRLIYEITVVSTFDLIVD